MSIFVPNNAGTVTFTNGSKVITGTSTLFRNYRAGSVISIPGVGSMQLASDPTSDTAAEGVVDWQGSTVGPVEFQYLPRNEEGVFTDKLTSLLNQIGNGNIQALAGLTLAANKVLGASGPGALKLIDRTEFVDGVHFDARVADQAGLSLYAGKPGPTEDAAGFTVLVEDWTDGRAAIVSKLSDAIADWSEPGFVTGPQGIQGIQGEKGDAYQTDATADDMAGLTAYDSEDDGYRVFVRDLGVGYDNRSGVVVKAASAWDVVALYTGPRGAPSVVPGPVGPPGIVWLGAWDDETVFALNDGVENNGSSWRSLQDDNLNHPPPALPATSNAWWQLLAAKGVDGTGTGDVVGPSGAVDGRIAVFDGTTGKIIKDSGLKPEDIGSVDALFEDDLGKTPSEQTKARENIDATSRVEHGRSLTVNGSLLVSQENGNTLGTANGYFYADQKALYRSSDLAGKISVQRVAYSSLAGGSKAAEFKCVSTATLVATSLATDTDFVEGSDPKFVAAGWGAAGAKPFVYRKEVQKPAGTYSFHFANRANNRHMWVQYTIGAGEANTPVIVEVQVPPDTTGTWSHNDGEIGLVIDDVLVLGSNYVGGTEGVWGSTNYQGGAGQKNFLDSTSNVAHHTDFGLKLDPSATGVYGQYEVGEVDPVYRSERYARRRSGRRYVSGAISSSGDVFVSEHIGLPMCKPPLPIFGTAESVSFGTGWVAAAGPTTLGEVQPDTISYVVDAYTMGTNYDAVVAYADWLLLARLS